MCYLFVSIALFVQRYSYPPRRSCAPSFRDSTTSIVLQWQLNPYTVRTLHERLIYGGGGGVSHILIHLPVAFAMFLLSIPTMACPVDILSPNTAKQDEYVFLSFNMGSNWQPSEGKRIPPPSLTHTGMERTLLLHTSTWIRVLRGQHMSWSKRYVESFIWAWFTAAELGSPPREGLKMFEERPSGLPTSFHLICFHVSCWQNVLHSEFWNLFYSERIQTCLNERKSLISVGRKLGQKGHPSSRQFFNNESCTQIRAFVYR